MPGIIRGTPDNIGSSIIRPTSYSFTKKDADDRPTVDTTGGWIEQIDNLSPGSEEYSLRYARASLTGWIPDDPTAFYNFKNSTLGYHYVDGSGVLMRKHAMEHPRAPGLFASKISNAQGFQFTGRGDGHKDPTDSNDLKQYATYGRRLVTIEFSPVRYMMYDDSEILGKVDDNGNVTLGNDGSGAEPLEFFRYVECQPTTNIYDVTIQTGQFAYTEGPAKNKVFQGEINFLEVKTTFNLVWKSVPEDYVYDNLNYFFPFPTKINAATGRVNSKPFCGFPAGTLLLLEPSIDRAACGTLRGVATLGAKQVSMPYFLCDVHLPIIHFDPPRHSSSNRGHNLKPWRAAGQTSLTYYLVKYATVNTTTGAVTIHELKIYGEYDFYEIFRHWKL